MQAETSNVVRKGLLALYSGCSSQDELYVRSHSSADGQFYITASMACLKETLLMRVSVICCILFLLVAAHTASITITPPRLRNA